MRRNPRSIATSPETFRHIDGLTEANFNLLTRLIGWLDGHEKQHTKYRMAMINRVARVEAALSLLLIPQQAYFESKPPWHQRPKLDEYAKSTENLIAFQSEQAAMKIIRYIYGNEQARECYQESLRGVVAEQSATNAKLVVCVDNNTKVLEECRDELRGSSRRRNRK